MSHVLIVDDHEDSRYLLRAILVAAGHTVAEAANGVEALGEARAHRPDLVISDILMPQMDGFALCRAMKREPETARVPFVVYTATYTDRRDEALALELGAARFIVKPQEPDAFLAQVQEVLGAHEHGTLPVMHALEDEREYYRLYSEALIRKLEDRSLQLERANASLSESEQRFRRLAESAPDLIYRYELLPAPRFAYVSPASAPLLGYAPEEFYADPELARRILDRGDRHRLMEVMRSESPSRPLVLRWSRRDGRSAWIEHRSVPVFDSAGNLVAVEGIARDVTERWKRERELESIVSVGEVQREAQSRSALMSLILAQLEEVLGAEGSLIATLDASSGRMLTEAAHGAWSGCRGVRLSAGEGVSSDVLASRRPFVCANLGEEPRITHADLLAPLTAAACAPLVAHSVPLGVLWIGRRSEIGADDVRLLTALANMTASALHRITLHEEAIRRVDDLQALRTIEASISSSLDVGVTLEVLLEQCRARLQVDAASVLLLDPGDTVLRCGAHSGFRSRVIEGCSVRVGEGAAGSVARDRRPAQIPDLRAPAMSVTRQAIIDAEGFVTYHAAPLVAKGHVNGVLEVFHRSPATPPPEWLRFLETLAGEAAIAVDNVRLFEGLEKANLELTLAYDSTIEGWSRALDLRDKETEGHTQRVTEMTERLARAAELPADRLPHVRRGALLHDIGKMGIPDAILLKPGPLTDEEWVVMRTHTTKAVDLLSPIAHLGPAIEIPWCHHEKWDGTGYPRGLRGEEIPLAARLFAAVDIWDALRSDRPYRSGWSAERVKGHIESLSGSHLDPAVVSLFLRLLAEGEPPR